MTALAAPSPVLAGMRGRCPRCGEGRLFAGYLRFAAACSKCGADFRIADAGDGPAVFVIFAVGAVVVPFLFILQFGLNLPGWLSISLTAAATVGLCLALLPPFKGALFALQWRHRASQATNDDLVRKDD